MAPGGGGKRKRNDRTFSHDEGQGRPSPHRPESLNLAQQQQRHDGGRNDRRNNRRGQHNNGSNSGNSSSNANSNPNHASGPNATPTPSRATRSTAAASPVAQSLAVSSPAPPKRDAQAAEPPPARSSQSTPAPPLQQAPRQPSPPREAPQPYTYDYLTDGVVSRWKESGKQSIMDAFAQGEDRELTASAIIQELIRSTIDGRIGPADSGAVLKDMLQQQSDNDRQELQSLVADTINVLEERDWKTSALRSFISASAVSTDVLREELDVETLQALGLVRNTFSTMRNRKTTNLIYRQANFNLLREESEGYSKLITEYFNVSHVDNLSEPVAEDAFQRIKALVGSFDLDVGRVLDITLDLIANLLIKNNRFFVKFLRASSWWPEDNIPESIEWTGQDFTSLPAWALPNSGSWNHSQEERDRLSTLKEARDAAFWDRLKDTGMDAFFDLGARTITNMDHPAVVALLNTEVKPELNARSQDTNLVRRTRINNARKWMRETGCLPPTGNPDAAQILGFKLAFYASDSRDAKDEMPDNLIWMSALLIKIGFISLRDLYPHLYPPDEKMAEVRTALQKEKEEREKASRPGGSTTNALAMAGALADDTLSVPAARAQRDADRGAKSPRPDAAADAIPEVKDELPEPANQKIMLLKSLLLIGALPEALFILGKFPWLADLVPDLPEYIHRILDRMLINVYQPTRPLAERHGLSEPRDHIGDPVGLPKGSLKFTPGARPRSIRWANLERGDIGDGVEYKYYWDDWHDNVPVCQNVDHVFLMCNTILNYSGVKIGRDSSLLMKLTRIGKKSLADDQSVENTTRWIDLCKRLLVPALSLTKHNTGNVNEMFELLKMFPIATRYSIYAEWHFGATSRNPDIQSAFKLTQAETRDVLKRISKTNVRAMGKALSKVAFASPGVVMQVAIHQMESYDNLIDVVVECVRYFSMLGYDVLVWCLMTALGGGGRNRVQADGMLTSAWLRALSNFAGSIFKRYSAIDPSPILQYVTHELRSGNSTDLEILEQIITGMAGIRSDVTFNESQVLAMAGGKILQAQTLISVADERHKMEKTSRRLVKALTEPGLAGQLLISIAQERQMYPNHDDAKFAPLKVLGNNVDKIHEVFNQYLDTLKSNLSSKDFDAVVPDIVSLITEFGLEPGIAFLIGRSSIAVAIAEHDASREAEQRARRASQGQDKPALNGDITMSDADEKPTLAQGVVTDDSPDVKKESKLGSPVEGAEVEDAKELVRANGIPAPTPTPAPELGQDTEATAYWHPALTPTIEKLEKVMDDDFKSSISIPFYVTFWSLSLEDILVNSASYEQELTAQNLLLGQINNDRSDMSVKATKEREVKKKAIVELKESLTQEMREQIKTYQRVRGRLIQEKSYWFSTLKLSIDKQYTSLIQNCFLPRLFLSPLDAHYTLTMIKFLHNNGAPGFRTMYLYDHLFRKNQLAAIIYQSTAREAENFGRFLNDLLKDLRSWHGKEDMYEKSAQGVKKNLPGFAKKLHPDGTPEVFLEYEDYRRLLFKWHSILNMTFQLCFQSGEYMHIRNAIVVLKCIHTQFPAVNFMGNKMVEEVTKISKEDTRGDLKLAAMSLIGNLRRLEKSWLLPQDFRINNAIPTQKSGSSRSATPVTLNPAASEFKPTGPDAVPKDNGESARSEDGEVDEEKNEFTTQASDDNVAGALTKKDDGAPSKAVADLAKKPEPSRAATPSAGNTSTPTPISRPSSTQPPGRTPHALPVKPNVGSQPPARAHSDRLAERTRPPRHDGRERGPPTQDYGRLEPVDQTRVPATRSREVSPGRRSRARSPERDHSLDRRGDYARTDDRMVPRTATQDVRMPERDPGYGPPRRDAGPPMHSSRGPEFRSDARSDARGYLNGTTSMPPPAPSDRQGRSERGGQTPRLSNLPPQHPSSTPGSQPATPGGVNPARLALITGSEVPGSREENGRLREESRRDRDDRRDRGSRPQSPRRAESVPSRPDPREEARRAPLDPNPFHSRSEQGSRRDEPRRVEPAEPTPTGPRSGRSSRNDPSRGELPAKPRDLFEAQSTARRPVPEPSHGRLNQDDRPPQDTSYGRLNQGPETPLGPRGLNGPPVPQPGRNFTPTGPSADGRPVQPLPSQPAQSPAIRRPGQQQQPPNDRRLSQFDRPTAPSSAPSGPASSPHLIPPPPPPPPVAVGVHPSRLQHIPLEIQTAPSGPRNGAPTGPAALTPTATNSPGGNRPPSGPSAGDRRRFAGLNETLTSNTSTGGSDRGASIRGRASRQSSGVVPAASPVSTFPGTPTGPGNVSHGARGQQPQTPSGQPQATGMHPSRMENIAPAPSVAVSASGERARRDDDRGDRHRSSRDEPPSNDRSTRHSGRDAPAQDSRDYARGDAERDARNGSSRGARGEGRGDRDRNRDSRGEGRSDGRDARDGREGRDGRGEGRERRARGGASNEVPPMQPPPPPPPPPPFGNPQGDVSGYPSNVRGYDTRSALPSGNDYPRRENGGRGSGGGRDERGSGGGGSGGQGSGGRGSDRKRRGDDMNDRDRGDKRRRSDIRGSGGN